MDKEYIFYNDIVESNGKTIAENNREKKHNIPIGSLVELEDGERLYVALHERDVDQTPLYWLCMKEDIEDVINKKMFVFKSGGYSEDSLILIKKPKKRG